jgi:hypothetical protein
MSGMNTYADEGPSPGHVERLDDAAYADDFATLVEVLGIELDAFATKQRPVRDELDCARFLAQRMTYLSTGEYWRGFVAQHGLPKGLRALATALEQRS